jgi:TPR repeat protein
MEPTWIAPDAWRSDGTTFSDISNLRTNPWTAILAARETRPGQAVDVIIKTFSVPRDVVQDPERIAAERERFLAAAKLHKDLSDVGIRSWVHVFHLSEDPANTAFVMKKCGPSLQDYLDNRLALSAKDLYALVQSVLQGLHDLFERHRRAHGNLKPSDVLVACPGDNPPYKLSDPASKAEDHSANDLYALGLILYRLIEHREYDPLVPLIPTARWDRFGPKRDRWMHFITMLLNPNGWHDPLPRVIKESQRLKPATPVRNAALAVTALLLLAGGAVAAYFFLPPLIAKIHPPAPTTIASTGNAPPISSAISPDVQAAYNTATAHYNDVRTQWQSLVNNSKYDQTKARNIARSAREILPDQTARLNDNAAVRAAADAYTRAADKLKEALAVAAADEAAGQAAEKAALDAFNDAKTDYQAAKTAWDDTAAKLNPRFPHPRSTALAQAVQPPDLAPPTDPAAIRNAAIAFHAAADKLKQAVDAARQEEDAASTLDKLRTAFDQARARYQGVNDKWEIASKAAAFDLKKPKALVDEAHAALQGQIILSDSNPDTYKHAADQYAAAAAKIEEALQLLQDARTAGEQTTADTSLAVSKANEALGKGDFTEALTWYTKAANLGYAPAMAQVGLLYETGQAGEKDLSKAARWYKQGADAGDARAITNLAALYEKGRGVDKDLEKAASLYRKAAELHYPPAMVNLGVFYENGIGVDRNYSEAKSWYEKAAAANPPSPVAMFYIGALYDKGKGVPIDYEQAMAWYKKAADLKNAAAMNAIGNLYDTPGYKQDPAQAMTWYRKAADAGFAPAMCNVGAMYDNGKGVPLDHAEAFKWFQKAANLNNGMAMFNLGILFETGRGVDKDINQALTWYRKAAHSDDPAANNSARDRLGKLGFPVGE